MDNMFQLKILSSDTRLLYVPAGIKKIIMDPLKHIHIAKNQDGEECILHVYLNQESNMIKSGGIEIHGLQFRSILKKKLELEQVLEKHVYVPNNSFLELEEAVRVNTQIILENNLDDNFKAVEIINEQTNRDTEPVLVFVKKALKYFPLVDSDLTISSTVSPNKTPGIKFETVNLTPQSNILLYIGSKLLQQPNTLKQLFTPLTQNGFILTRENVDVKVQNATNDIEILTDYTTPNERIILLRKKDDIFVPRFIEVSSNNFEWLSELQKSLNLQQNIITFASNRDPEGILGLINCIRKETNGSSVRCFFMIDDAQEFDPQHPFYSKQISKNLAVNIYKDKSWGTYRNLLLEERPKIKCEHSYAHFKTGGGISSFEWIEGPLLEEVPMKQEQLLISTFYSSVNFKDVLAASGRANLEILQTHSLDQNLLVGFEFSGKDSSGRRIAGMTNNQGISASVTLDSSLAWKVPDAWTLEDAATVPVVYSAVIYAVLVGDMKPGSSVLIHSATGGFGLAALNICLYYKCDVYVTVGTHEKRAYLRENYPQIPDNHIGNSRNTSFEQMINRQTRSRGVEYILNTLSEDKRPASIRCLAQGGQLMEFGTYDLANDSAFNILLMKKNATYHGISLDVVFRNFNEMRTKVVKRLIDGIEAGFVKPLPRVVFNAAEIEKSFRYMMAGKHIGKILIKLRNEEEDKVHINQINKLEIMSNPGIHFNHRYTYVIIGGLGSVGLELSDWLVLRGARKLVLNSRSGIQNGYHQRRINIWLTYGVEVKISTKYTTTEQGCEDLIKEASKLGPIDAIFNLDGLFENQTKENLYASLARNTLYLDRVTKKLCPKLRYFVIFSSESCRRDNPGEINNNMANFIMERICESRKREGLPAVAIQWTTNGEVVKNLLKDFLKLRMY
ncbi:fatty acid synthase-like isoform X2 [Zophobas morio]|uniref:fatty acid synthase-like isoform X2 n=1 Tax=Zophobas morio TaxID=2755281 RepID=UPI003083C13B